MKNLLTFTITDKSFDEWKRYEGFENFEKYIKAQIDNSLDLGWPSEDIILATNFDYEYNGVKAVVLKEIFQQSAYYNKQFNILELINTNVLDELTWYHDVDVWQIHPFNDEYIEYDLLGDLGACRYMFNNEWNTGTLFIRPTAKDMFEFVVKMMEKAAADGKVVDTADEPVMNTLIRRNPMYYGRYNDIDTTYNIGMSGFDLRYNAATKPIMVAHFHPDRKEQWDHFVEGKNSMNVKVTDDRLNKVLLKHFGVIDEKSIS